MKKYQLLLIVGMTVFLLYSYCIGFPRNPIRKEQMLALLQQNLYKGDKPPKVISWLEANRFQVSHLDGKKDDLSLESVVNNSHYTPNQLGSVTRATMPDVKRSFLTKWDLHVIVFYSKNNELIDYEVSLDANGI